MDLDTIASVLDKLQTYVLPHAAFVGVTAILLVLGQWASGVFTKTRAYRFYGYSKEGKWKWRFFYWGRELLPVYPIAAGVFIGLCWLDPENKGWGRPASVGYFASAGACSMVLWSVVKGWSKKKGITFSLPGESEPPEGDKTPYDEKPPSVPPNLHDLAASLERQAVPRFDKASLLASDEDLDARPTLPPTNKKRFPKP